VKDPRFIVILLLVAFALRAGLLVLVPESATLAPDSVDYLELADALRQGDGYSRAGQAELFRPPGYPVCLAAVNVLTGGRASTVMPWLQVLVDCLNILLVLALARQLTPQCSPRWAMGWQVIATTAIVYSCKLLSETLFTCVFLLLLCLAIRVARRLSADDGVPYAQLLLLLPCLGLMLYLRAITLPLVACLVGWCLLWRRWQLALVLFLGLVACAAPWVMRNQAHGFSGFGCNGDVTFYRYHATALAARQNGRSFAEQQTIHTTALLKQEGQGAQGEFAAREWKRIIFSSPFEYALIHLQKSPMALLPIEGELARMLGADVGGNGTMAVINTHGFSAGVGHYFGGNLWLLAPLSLLVLLVIAKFAFAGLGLWTALAQRDQWLVHGLLVISGLVCVGILGPDAHPRFRVPVEPILSLYAGLGLWRVSRGLRQKPLNSEQEAR